MDKKPKFQIGRMVISASSIKKIREGRAYEVEHIRFDSKNNCFVYRLKHDLDHYYKEKRFIKHPVKVKRVV